MSGAATHSVHPKAAPKRRRWRRYLIVLLIVLLLPVLVFFGAVAYIQFGFVNARVADELGKNFDAPATVGAVSTDWLRNVRVENIAVSPGAGQPLSIASVEVDWELGELLNGDRIRSVVVRRPSLNLRRDAAGLWNLRFKPRPSKEKGYRIERLALDNGDVAVEWAPGRLARLQSVGGTLTGGAPGEPQAFTVQGVLDSREKISAAGELGPGAAWSARAEGGVHLDRDLAAVLGPDSGVKGRLGFTLDAERTALPGDAARGGPVIFSGRISLKDFLWKLAGEANAGLAIQAAEQQLEVRGRVLPGSGADTLFALEDTRISAEKIGHLEAACVLALEPGTHLTVSAAQGAIDVDAVNRIFQPRLLDESISLRGQLSVTGVSLSLPIGSNAPPLRASAVIAAPDVRVGLRGLGELERCSLRAVLEWPALKDVRIALGDIGRLALSVDNVSPPGPEYLAQLARDVAIEEVAVDIGKLMESEFGRRLLTGTFAPERPTPPAAALPLLARGTIGARATRLNMAPAPRNALALSLPNLEAAGLKISRWPLPVAPPAKSFSGTLEAVAIVSGIVLQELQLAGKLSETGSAAPEAKASVEFKTTLAPDAQGSWRPGPVAIHRLRLPLADLAAMLKPGTARGIGGTGNLEITECAFDPATGAAGGTLALEDAVLRYTPPPDSSLAGMGGAALANVDLRMKFSLNGPRVVLRGRAEPMSLRIVYPILGEREYMALPALDFTVDAGLGEPGKRDCKLTLAWEGPNKIDLVLNEAPEGAWRAAGRVETPWGGGLAGSFSLLADLPNRLLREVAVAFDDLPLERAAKILAGRGLVLPEKSIFSGELKNLKLALDAPLAPESLWLGDRIPPSRVTGTLKNAGYLCGDTEVAGVDGDFTCKFSAEYEKAGFDFTATLSSYAALLTPAKYYLPPPLPGRGGALRVEGTHARRPGGAADVKITRCELNVSDLVQATATAAAGLADGALVRLNLENLSVKAADLAQARKVFVEPNIRNLDPWFGDIGLEGGGSFAGALSWQAGGGAALSGKLGFANAGVSLGKSNPLALRQLDGELPLSFQWGAPAAGGAAPAALAGRMKTGPLKFMGMDVAARELAFTATPNALRLDSTVELALPGGVLALSGASIRNLMSSGAEPEIGFDAAGKIELDRILRERGIALNGIEGCTLSGPPMRCRLVRTSGLRGPWELAVSGGLRGPFFGGEIVLEGLNARGIFGPAPVFGGVLRVAGPEGVKVTQLTEQNHTLFSAPKQRENPKYVPSKFALRANAEMTGIEAAGLGPESLQSFQLDVRSVDFKDNDFYYNGTFAMWANYPLVRAAFPTWFKSDEEIMALTFGVRRVGMRYILKNGVLYGPIPLLPNDLIIQAYGTEKGVGALFADRFKQDIKGDTQAKADWAQMLKKLSQ